MGLQHGGRKPVETSWVYFRARNMLPRNNVLLFLCTDCCSVAPLLRCSVAPFLCSSVPLFFHSSVPLFLCSSVPLFLCSSVPLFLCSYVPMFLCSFLRSSVSLLLFSFLPTPTSWISAVIVTKEYYTDNAKPYSIYFTTIKKNVRFFKAWPRAWHIELEQRCLDSYRQRQISQPDCETSSKLPGLTYREPIPPHPHPLPSAS